MDILPSLSEIKSGSTTATKEVTKLLKYVLLPTGAGQLTKIAEGAELYKHDVPGKYIKSSDGTERLKYEVGTDPVSVLKNLAFGQYSSKQAQNYFDNEYSALGTKQTEIYKNSSIQLDDFRKYTSKINDFKADKDEDGKSISGTAKDKKS